MPFQDIIGKPAPSFSLLNYDGETFTFAPGEKTLPTVLFFYPESGSYGCTREACQFRDAIAEKETFKPGHVDVIGISPDPVEKQKAFVDKHKLTFPVLSDVEMKTSKSYGLGSALFGMAKIARVTFIVDKKGITRDAMDATMNYSAHTKFVSRWLDKLKQEDEATTSTKDVPAPTATASADAPTAAAVPEHN